MMMMFINNTNRKKVQTSYETSTLMMKKEAVDETFAATLSVALMRSNISALLRLVPAGRNRRR